MHTSRRILILCAAGTVIYLILALYHGRQLDKIPSQPAVNGQGRSAKAQEKNWVQVSTADDRPGQTLQGQTEQRQGIPPAEAEDDRKPTDSAGAADPGGKAAMAGEDPELRLADLQAELQENARRLREALATEQRAKRQAEETIHRLQAELQETRTRAAIAGEEQRQARLKAEAMFKYGQEQSRQLAPALLENEALRARLQEADSKLRQAEEQISTLTRLRGSGPAAVQTDDPESGATAAPAPAGSAGPGETRAGHQTD